MSKLVVERLRHALDQRRQQIDAEAHIAGLDDDRARGDALDHGVVASRKAGGADDMHEAALGGDRDIGDGRGRHGEIDRCRRPRPTATTASPTSLTPLAGSPASTPASLPNSAEPRRLQRAGKHRAFGFRQWRAISARPIRPPAPATIKRMSDISAAMRPRRTGAGIAAGQRSKSPRPA